MKPNIVKSIWKEDKIVSNAWITIPNAWTAELIAQAGFDVMTIDAQHGLARDLETVLSIFQAMKGSETVPFVRAPWNDPSYIMAMLDAGAMGIICPMINNREETEHFVQACMYAPMGYRSFGPVRARAIHDGYFEAANREIVKMAMIETPDAYKNLEDIAATPNLDGLFLGPWDLSISMGLKEIANFDGSEMAEIFTKLIYVRDKFNLKLGVHCGSTEDACKLRGKGFDMVTVFNDSRAITEGAAESLRVFRK